MVDDDGQVIDDDIEYIVPRDKDELQSVFDDLKNLGFTVDDKPPDKPARSASDSSDNPNVDADLEKEVSRMFDLQIEG